MKTGINSEVLLGMYKRMKRNPNRVFLAKDFGPKHKRNPYFPLLIRLGLIEQVPVKYRMGKNLRATKLIKGYKFVNPDKSEVKG